MIRQPASKQIQSGPLTRSRGIADLIKAPDENPEDAIASVHESNVAPGANEPMGFFGSGDLLSCQIW